MKRLRSIGLILLALLPGRAGAGEACYVLFFAAQRPGLNRPSYTHTWATFVKVTPPGPERPGPEVEAVTISWMPANLRVRPWALRPEPGVNLDLGASLAWAAGAGLRVSRWGPYRTEPWLYEEARRKHARLASGAVLYKSNDAGHHSDRVSNCVKAVADVVEGPRTRVTQRGWGERATASVVRKYRPFLIGPDHTHAWLPDALGLERPDPDRPPALAHGMHP